MQLPHCNDRPNPLGCGPWYMTVLAELSRWDKSAPLVDPQRHDLYIFQSSYRSLASFPFCRISPSGTLWSGCGRLK